ncbi:primase homolog protein isoform X2 [Durio zibethinus]|uniref:Primase homolog protein isoform X2 n=1 Tax=Durio zibethinus TaxID=66656 RepID=A0A6P5WYV3_DURZI|nr:primase homolog protein isoform X2 [Durio zibethinus]
MPFANNIIRHRHFFFFLNPTRLSVCSSARKFNPKVPTTPTPKLSKLTESKKKIELLGIQCLDCCLPGRYNCLFCPQCRGGKSMDKTLSQHNIQHGYFAMRRCFQTNCGWAGQAFADSSKITINGTKLEPIGDELVAYFAERRISKATLQRNAVMQKSGDQAVIAFTYRRNGAVVGCKYRTLEKKFWQEKGTKKWLYGLDDIEEAAEVIIVEGEIDKLAVEEAGLHNCVSVPSGAPQMVSAKELPTLEKDTAYQYLWNCKEYLDKVSRVILATDVDNPGNALAEELARRLGKERCWRVHWPKKDDCRYFKDANEVLKCLGAGALKEVIENAEPYQESV